MNGLKMVFLLATMVLTLTGCTRAEKATQVLESQGFKNIEITGYQFFGCGDRELKLRHF